MKRNAFQYQVLPPDDGRGDTRGPDVLLVFDADLEARRLEQTRPSISDGGIRFVNLNRAAYLVADVYREKLVPHRIQVVGDVARLKNKKVTIKGPLLFVDGLPWSTLTTRAKPRSPVT